MGNCQAAEAATVVIEHPKGRVERVYWSLSANEIMSSNPGHYVATVLSCSHHSLKLPDNAPHVKQLKLLRPDDTLHIGHVYRLITFEEVLKEFGGKRYTKLGRLISRQEEKKNGGDNESDHGTVENEGNGPSLSDQQAQDESSTDEAGRRVSMGRHQRQWRPALQSIAEVGS